MQRSTRLRPLSPVRTWVVLFAANLVVTIQPQTASAQSCPVILWADEFDGASLDLNKWSYQLGDGCSEGICGWGNNELETYQEENVTVSDGSLKIEAREQRVKNKNYTSGRIRTLNKGEWTHGRFEARIRLTQGQGIWPAFWMLPTDEVYGGWPQSGEIDIMENVGHQPDVTHGTIHYGDPFPGNQNTGASFRLNSGVFADGFHEFAIEKEPGVIRWFVDDVLFSTKTTDDTDPFNWPFDERFHFILNVAVGGNWPGSPDATTVFPQVLEVDYVRVYDGIAPYIAGDRVVAHQEAGVTYVVGNAPSGSSFTWSVPSGATIASGQGTASIVVDWGASGGTVTAQVTSICGAENLAIDVAVEQPFAREFSFENFDEPENLTLDLATGTLTEVANPDPSGINSSALSGEYVRNSSQQYDVVAYDVGVIGDASAYSSNQKKFYIDLFTNAPLGSTVLLQLESSALATSSNYPTGRHSRYQAQTEVQNEWERIELPLLDRPDASTPDTGVDKLILLFAPNSFTGHVFTFDNLDSYAVSTGGGGTAPSPPTNLAATAASSSQIDLSWSDASTDEDGFHVERSTDETSFSQIGSAGVDETSFQDDGLAASTTYFYRVRAFNTAGASSYSNTATATTSGSGGSATSVHVSAIAEGSQSAGQGNKHGTATVTVVDNLGNPVSSALLSGTFSGDFNESASGTTGSGGSVTLITSGVKKGGLNFTFCVEGVTHGSLAYDPSSNVVTCSDGAGKRTGGSMELPGAYTLDQNYPNPFNPTTEIRYTLAVSTRVKLQVYDLLGQRVATLVDAVQQPGVHSVRFDAQDLPSGTYLYRLEAEGFGSIKKMVLLR